MQITQTRLLLENFHLKATIGVHEWEKHIQQELILSLNLVIDLSQACHSDQLEDTLDYTKLGQKLTETALIKPYQLIEHLAYCLTQALYENWPAIQNTQLKLSKKGIFPNHALVSFELDLARHS